MKLMNWLIVALVVLHPVSSHAQSSRSAREPVKKNAAASVQRGLAKRTRGDLEGAIEDFEKAAAIDPKSVVGNRFVAQAYSNRGFIRLNALEVDSAIADFTKAININPNEDGHYYRRGYARLINEDLTEALNDLTKALTVVGPDNFSSKTLIYATRAKVKLLQGKTSEAQMDFDECIRSNKEKFDLDGYLWGIEMQIKLMRERRANQRRTIA